MKPMQVLLAIGLLSVLFMAGCAQQGPTQGAPPSGGSAPTGAAPSGTAPSGGAGTGSGLAVFTIADKAADMGTVTSVKLTVNSVQAHGSGGWVTLSSTPMTFDLLSLKASGVKALLAEANLTSGSYDQVRLEVANVSVTDSSGTHDAVLPSGDLKIVGGFNVSANSTSVASFDFIADRSLHVTGNGKYMLAPVVHLQTTEGASVDASDATDVKVSGGSVKTDVEVGMDENGTVGAGVSIPADANVTVDDSGHISVGAPAVNVSSNGRVVVGVKDKTANMSSVTSVNVTISGVMVQSQGGWTTLSSTPQTFDLLKLNQNGSEALLADVNVTSGTYEQIRLEISNVTVTDANGTHEAKLPSGDLRLTGPLVVNGNSTSTLTFDFLANESLHVTGNGEYILAPVIHMQTMENATVRLGTHGDVESRTGSVDADAKVGMDQNGDVGVGLGIPADADVSVDGNGRISVGAGTPHGPPVNSTVNWTMGSGY